jgi:hypothetical protein
VASTTLGRGNINPSGVAHGGGLSDSDSSWIMVE